MRVSYPQALLAMMAYDPSVLHLFPADMAKAALRGPKQVLHTLIAWHHTVEVYQDIERLSALTAEIDAEDLVEVPRPAAS